MARWLAGGERVIVFILVGATLLVTLLAALELLWIIGRDVVSPPLLLLEPGELLEILGMILLVLIGLELLETIKAYLETKAVHVEIVLEVALLAIARKVIVLDLEKYSGLTVAAIALLMLALAGAVFVERRFRNAP